MPSSSRASLKESLRGFAGVVVFVGVLLRPEGSAAGFFDVMLAVFA